MIVLLISAIGITVFLYYKNLAWAPLRILSLILLYILITNVTLNIQMEKKINPPALLVDCSTSMKRYLPDVIQAVDKITFPYSFFFFSESLVKHAALKDSFPGGAFTDITGALSEVGKLQPSAIILISDGNHNYGEFPLSAARDLNTSVYCFGVGGEIQKELSIIDVIYPAYVFKGDSINIKVIVESKGFSGGKAQIWLRSPLKRIEQNKLFPLSNVVAKNTVDFWIYAAESGEENVHVYLTPQSGEGTYEDNRFEFSFYTLENKIDVLYYTDHLSFTTKFILRALNEDNHIKLLPIMKKTKNEYVVLNKKQGEHSVPHLDNYDVLILDNVNLSELPWHRVAEFTKTGRGILCMGSIQGFTDLWRDILPMNTTETFIKGNYPIEIIQPFSCLVLDDDYPPLFILNRIIGVKENAVIIAKSHQFPVIAYRNYGQGIVFQINILDIGTWQFLQTGIRQQSFLFRFIGDIVRFISPAGQKRRLALRSMQRNYILGETVDLTLQSFDRDFKLTGGGDFYVDLGDAKVPFFEQKKGMYEATFVAKRSGKFQIKAVGKLKEEMLSSNTLEITVSSKVIEMERDLNRQLLQTLAAKTGGTYGSIDELENFQLPMGGKKYVTAQFNFNSPISYFLIFILFAVDWFTRRKRGII